MERKGELVYKSDEENPYDSEEREYLEDAKADEGSEISENTYDSEFEAEFFGKKDPELNK